MKKILKKKKFLKALQEEWHIEDSMILEKIEKDFGDEIEKYSVEHYIKLKQALIMKIETFNEEEKKAYIQCEKLNYKILDSYEGIDYIIYIMTGGLVVSVFDKTVIESNGPILTTFFLVVIMLCVLAKGFLIATKKYKFVLRVLEDIENNL